jgi:hypothetical protein
VADYTTTGLLASIRRRASLPNTATAGTADADLLAYANEELRLRLTAQIMSLREDYFLTHDDRALSGVRYRIPTRAIGGKLAGVYLLDAEGNVRDKLERESHTRLEDWGVGAVGNASAIHIEGNTVVLLPSASSTATTIRLSYYARPGELVAAGAGSVAIPISAIVGGVATVKADVGGGSSDPLDIVKASPGFETTLMDAVAALDSSGFGATGEATATFASLDGVEAGDYITPAGTSPIPQIPVEFHAILAQRTALKALQALGDKAGVDDAKRELAEMEEAIGILASPRVDSSPQKIVNRGGALGGGWRRRYGGL